MNKLTVEEVQLLKEFAQETEGWIHTMRQMSMYLGKKAEFCQMCGIPFPKIQQVSEIVKKLL